MRSGRCLCRLGPSSSSVCRRCLTPYSPSSKEFAPQRGDLDVMTRRLALQRLFLSLWSAATAAACSLNGRGRTAGAPPATGPSAEFQTPSQAELDTLVAFGEVIVEGRALSAAERDGLAEE